MIVCNNPSAAWCWPMFVSARACKDWAQAWSGYKSDASAELVRTEIACCQSPFRSWRAPSAICWEGMAVDNAGSDASSASGVVVGRGVDVRKIVTGGGRVSCGAGGAEPVSWVQALVNASRAHAMIILGRIHFMITSHLLFLAVAFVHRGAVKKTMSRLQKDLYLVLRAK